MICKIDEKDKKYKIPKKLGRELIYREMYRAMYGHLLSGILWYKKLRGYVKLWGFEMNPYNECTFNMVIDGAQCTILYHVKDLKISH